jgi:hypothetical protein
VLARLVLKHRLLPQDPLAVESEDIPGADALLAD